MKQTIITAGLVVLGLALLAIGAEAATNLLKSQEIAKIGIGSDVVIVSRVVDGDTTCYVTKYGKFGSHAISCVK